ncbi:MAG TPA: YgjP-like metallopeptidase domain-containing protein, partial [Anaerolineae bacterium]|nr:YgjP-like metallopeptidase domain-containing protein [Anaerolineae bacterium]
MSRTGEVVVVLPGRMPAAEAERLVLQHAAWLQRHVSRVSAERAALAARPPLGEGRVLQVAGESRRISTVDGGSRRPARGRVESIQGGLVVRLGSDGRSTSQLLERWLRIRARDVIVAHVGVRAADL